VLLPMLPQINHDRYYSQNCNHWPAANFSSGGGLIILRVVSGRRAESATRGSRSASVSSVSFIGTIKSALAVGMTATINSSNYSRVVRTCCHLEESHIEVIFRRRCNDWRRWYAVVEPLACRTSRGMRSAQSDE